VEEKKYLTVTALTKYLKHVLESDPHLSKIYLRGEVSNLTKHSRGHYYFSLKDENAQIRAVMFASQTRKLNFSLKEGDKVLVFGSINVYEPSGSYSLLVYEMEPDGIGALYLAYEKLKKELAEKGYFKAEHKKAIPKYPNTIGVITSPTGAAIRDIINTIKRRYPLTKVILYPTLVQGEGAKKSISDNIIKANSQGLVDVLIVGRGGGSIEDLWAFNEIEVVEAIFNSNIPIISAIGHETDFTLSDFVSDLRAPTPTAGAELATPDINILKREIKQTAETIKSWFSQEIRQREVLLVHLEERLSLLHPLKKIAEIKRHYEKLKADLKRNYQWQLLTKKQSYQLLNNAYQKFDLKTIVNLKKEVLITKEEQLKVNLNRLLTTKQQTLALKLNSLEYLNPLKLLKGGYSITIHNDKRITSIDEVELNEEITTYFKDGKLTTKVKKKERL